MSVPDSQVAEARDAIRSLWPVTPQFGIILGTGMGNLTKLVEEQTVIEYADIPHFPRSTAISHRGQLICGQIKNVPLVMMNGRFHLYEGYSAQQVTFPIHVMKQLGVHNLIVGNAAGAVNPYFQIGEIEYFGTPGSVTAVDPKSKLTTTWGSIKNAR